MLPMKYIIFPFIVAISLISCNSHSGHWATLSQVDSIIEAYPDSALKVLERMEPTELSGKEEKAKYALLLSMALDKNLVDRTDFEVLQPAIDYYADNGTPTEKLRTYFYQGRIYQNQGNDALAMECFVTALTDGGESEDIKTKARVYFAQSKLYYSLYEWDEFIKHIKKASSLYKDAGINRDYAACLILTVNGYTLMKDSESAQPYIDECRLMFDKMSLSTLCDFYSSYLTYLINFGTAQDIVEGIEEYTTTIPSANIDWLTIAYAYMKLERYDDAQQMIANYQNSNVNLDKDLKYQAIVSTIYKKLGKYKEALCAYEQFLSVSDSTNFAMMQQDTKFVNERHNLELQNLKERESKKSIFLLATICVVFLLAIIVYIRSQLKVKNMEKAIAQQNAARYQELYRQMEEERDNLTLLLEQSDGLSPDVKKTVGKRLDLLNKFFAAYITNNSEIDRSANREMEELLANKDAFMASTKYAFACSHPKFIKYLEEKGLTDWEINYCCLYALGLKGKEVGAYIQMRSHYNNSSEIREKLGINEHDTNLGIYIRKLLRCFE